MASTRTAADQSEHIGAELFQLARADPWDRHQRGVVRGQLLGDRDQGVVGEDHERGHRHRGGGAQSPLLQLLEQFLVDLGGALLAAAQHDRGGPGCRGEHVITDPAARRLTARASRLLRGPSAGRRLRRDAGQKARRPTVLPTTGGALAFDGFVPPYEATLVKNLRDAGAIIIAKTGMTELANWVAGGPTPMPGNYNGLGGYGYNPYDPRAVSPVRQQQQQRQLSS